MEVDECKMIYPDSLPMLTKLMVCFIGGVIVGYAYFKALRMTTELIMCGRHPFGAVALTVGRMGLIFIAFYLAVQAGGLALLAALTGVLSAKAMMLYHLRQVGQ